MNCLIIFPIGRMRSNLSEHQKKKSSGQEWDGPFLRIEILILFSVSLIVLFSHNFLVSEQLA